MAALDEATILYVTRQLRGIEGAIVRFIGATPEFEKEFVDLLLGLGVSARLERAVSVAPESKRKISLSFRGKVALLTVDPSKPLNW